MDNQAYIGKAIRGNLENAVLAQQSQAGWRYPNTSYVEQLDIAGRISNTQSPTARTVLLKRIEHIQLDLERCNEQFSKLEKAGLLDMQLHEIRALVNL